MTTSEANIIAYYGEGGAVGSIAAVEIERGGLGAVTLVARSNYYQVNDLGYERESV